MNILSKIIRKFCWLLKIPRDMFLALRYGISPSKRVMFGKRVRIVNPRFIDMGGGNLP